MLWGRAKVSGGLRRAARLFVGISVNDVRSVVVYGMLSTKEKTAFPIRFHEWEDGLGS